MGPASIGRIMVVCGIIVLGLLLGAPYRVRRLRRHGVRTTGTVLKRVVEPDQVSRMRVDFVDQHGQPQTVMLSPVDTGRGVIAVRETFDILYLPGKPQHARPADVTGKLLGMTATSFPRAGFAIMLYLFRGEALRRWRLRKHGVRAEATVIWHRYDRDRQTPRRCSLIGYVDQDGHTRTFLSPAHGGERLPPRGRELPVIYLPRHVRSRPPGTPAEAVSFTTFGRSQAHLAYQATPADIPSYATLLSHFLLGCIVILLGFAMSSGD
ncbi:hypothetical protein [Saccharomonospora marina]|nr:hypothetical protein [Saccharomonospora marina]